MAVDDNAAVVDEVLDAQRAFCEAFSASDWPKVATFLGEEFRHTHSGGHTDGKNEWIEHCRPKRRSMTRDDLKVHVYGDVATVAGGLRMDFEQPPGEAALAPLRAFALQIWVKRDSGWQVVASQNTYLPRT